MFEKKQPNFTTPDLTKLQEVIIDVKTRIYIAVGADPKEARSRYFARIGAKKLQEDFIKSAMTVMKGNYKNSNVNYVALKDRKYIH